MFNTEIYTSRRLQLVSNITEGIILLLGNDESPMNYQDNTYHFRQDSTFLYYFGINSPGLNATIDAATGEAVIYGDEADIDVLVWTGQTATIRDNAAAAGVYNTKPAARLATFLKTVQAGKRTIHFLPPYRGENKLKLMSWLGITPQQVTETASVELIKAIASQRSVKSAEEVIEIEKAVNLSVQMQLAAIRYAKPGMSEAAIAALVQQVAQSAGAEPAYPIILTVNGHILHNHSKINVVKEGDMILNDSGAEIAAGYCGDLTRTFPAGTKFTSIQKDVYEIVLQALTNATNAVRPGTRYLDIHYTACRVLAEGLKSMGLMRGNIEDAVQQGAHAMFFQCGTGHMMGLDVHDMEDLGERYVGFDEEVKKETNLFGLKSLRLGKALQPGFVVTVEPGIYFNPVLIDKWDAEKRFTDFINYEKLHQFRNFTGIRLEDNVLITKDGVRILGTPLAKTVAEIEGLREQAF